MDFFCFSCFPLVPGRLASVDVKQQKLTDVGVFGKSRLKPRCCPGGSCAVDGMLKLKKQRTRQSDLDITITTRCMSACGIALHIYICRAIQYIYNSITTRCMSACRIALHIYIYVGRFNIYITVSPHAACPPAESPYIYIYVGRFNIYITVSPHAACPPAESPYIYIYVGRFNIYITVSPHAACPPAD